MPHEEKQEEITTAISRESEAEKEIERLRGTHTLYDIYAELWDLYLAAYEGGPEFANEENVFKHVREHAEDYNDRVKRLHYLNYCEFLVDFFTNFIFSETIERTPGEAEKSFYDGFAKDVNRKGDSIDEYMRLVACETQVFGMCYTLVDAPSIAAGQEITKQDEIDNGLRPYWVFLRPDEILDWVVDNFDKFQYAKRRQIVNRINSGGSISTIELYTEFFPNAIRFSEIDVSEPEKPILNPSISIVVNTLGIVPLYVHRFKRSKRYPHMGNSFLRDFAANNREIMNLTSLLQEFLYRQAFNILVKQVDTAIPMKEAEEGAIGTSNLMEIPKDAKFPQYLAPASDPAKFIQDERQTIKSEMFGRAAQEVSGDTSNGVGSSGFSLAQAFSKTVPFISIRADSLERDENNIMNLTLQRLGKTWTGRVKYKDRYEITNFTDSLTQFMTLTRDLNMPSETFDKAQLKRLVSEFDGKLPPEMLSKIKSEIDKMDHEEWKKLQQDALVGSGSNGTSPGDQQRDKGTGTTEEVQKESRSDRQPAATNDLKK